jgi:predicted Zn-dependent peptidase
MSRPLLAVLLACGCASRVPIAPPDLPLARTPDAAFRARAPAAEPSQPRLEPAPIERRALSNGMSVWVARRTDSPVTSVALAFRGAGSESAAQGIARLTATLLLQGGTRQANGPTLARLSINGQYPRITTFEDGSVLSLDVPSQVTLPAIQLLAQITRSPAFELGAFQVERNRQLYAIGEASLSSMRHLQEAALEELHGGPVFRSPLGLSERVAALTNDDVVRFYASRYRPEQTALIVVGDVELERILASANALFESWTPSLPPSEEPPRTLPELASDRRFVAIDAQKALAYGLCVALGPDPRHEDRAGFELAAMLLGGHAVSRAAEALRYHAGQVYSVGAHVERRGPHDHLVVRLGAERDDFLPVVRSLLAEIERLRHHPVGEEELARAKALFRGRAALALSQNRDVALAFSRDFLAVYPELAAASVERRVLAATAADVQRAAARWLRPDLLQLAALLDGAALKGKLAEFGRVHWLRFRAKDSREEAY